MAYWVNEKGTNESANVKSFYCDYESDIAKLPTNTKEGVKQDGEPHAHLRTKYGSDCFVIASGNVYILGKDTDAWIIPGQG